MIGTSTRTALRIARREARRALGRSALVVALVGLPVAALGYAAVAYDSFNRTPADNATSELGTADAAVTKVSDKPVNQPPDQLAGIPVDPDRDTPSPTHTGKKDLLKLLPRGTRLYPVTSGEGVVRTDHGIAPMAYTGLAYDAKIAEGMVTPLAGRAPRGDHEVALTRTAAERIGAEVGDDVELVEPEPGRYRVVGLIEYPDALRIEEVVFRPHAVPGATPRETRWLADTPAPLSWSDVRALNQEGVVVLSRQVLLNPPPDSEVPDLGGSDRDAEDFSIAVVLVGVTVLEIVLLAGPAFAIGARRRQRELALVSAAGGSARQICTIVLADGVVLGGLGAAVGLVIGPLAAVLSVPLLEEHFYEQRVAAIRLFPSALIGIAGLAVATGVLAALVPAINAARQDPVVGLSGRRGVTRSRRRWVVLGVSVCIVGVAVAAWGITIPSAAVILIGLVLAELGLVVCMPALVGAVGRLGRWLPLSMRIALRTTSRNRGAAAPAVAAVMAAVAAAVMIATVIGSMNQRESTLYHATLPEGHISVTPEYGISTPPDVHKATAEAVRRTLPVTDVHTLRTARCTGELADRCQLQPQLPERLRCPADDTASFKEYRKYKSDPRCASTGHWFNGGLPSPLVDDGSGLRALTAADPDDIAEAKKVLARGGAVVADPRYLVDGHVTLATVVYEQNGEETIHTSLRVPGYVLDSGTVLPSALFVGEPLIAELDMEVEAAGVAAATSRTPTDSEEEAAGEAIANLGGRLYVERGPNFNTEPYLLLLALIAGLITVGASTIATGLVLADSRRELGTLAAVGAAPALRRWLTLSQSGVISGLGTAVGAVAGFGAGCILMLAQNSGLAPTEVPYPYAVPWQVLLITAVLVPLIAMLGAGMVTRSRLPIERRVT